MKVLRPAWIPEDAKWYLADIVEEFVFPSDTDYDTLVHANLILVRADSPEEAYEKALQLGQEGEFSFINSYDENVNVVFRGLRDLYVIYDEFEHGSEILWTEYEGLSKDAIAKMITPKDKLSVFAPREVDEDD